MLPLAGLTAFAASLQDLVLPSPDTPLPAVEARRRAERRSVYIQPLVCAPLSCLFSTLLCLS